MENREKYIKWLANNSKEWFDATAGKYESVVRVTSDELLKKEAISKSLFKMHEKRRNQTLVTMF